MKKKSILLLNPPGKGIYFRDNYCSPESKGGYYWQPTDLLVQSGYLKDEFEVDILDAIVEKKTNEDVLNLIKERQYYSILCLTGTASWEEDFELLNIIKTLHPQTILALSGNLALFEYRELFKTYYWLDLTLLDYTTPDYCQFLLGKKNGLHKIVYRNGEDGVTVIDQKLEREFSYPFPLHQKFKNHLYHRPVAVKHPATIVIGSAGCPHKCEFCVASEIKYRVRNVDNIIAELKGLYEMGIKEVGFNDFMFDVNRDRTMEICDKIVAQKIKLVWACSCRIDTLDEELLKRMKAAGCHSIQVGIESAVQDVLNAQRKKLVAENVKHTIDICNRLGIRVFGNFIIGLPGETEESLRNMGKYARQLGCTNAVFSTLVPDIGTVLRKKAIADGKLDSKMTKFSSSDKIFQHPINGMANDKLASIRTRVMIDFYLHPSFIYNNFIRAKSFYEFKRNLRYGLQVLRKL